MIISHKLKCIFFAIPKTATHAIRIALRPHLDEADEEQVGLFVQKSFSDPEIAKLGHGHITCMQLKPSIGDEIWDSYYKFSFVRNPYDRFVSYCAFMNRQNPDFHDNPQSYMYNALLARQTKKHILFKPQYEFICDESGNLMIDYKGQYEDLQGGYNHIAQELNISTEELDQVNGSKHEHYSTYYNDELKELVYKMYLKDFELLGYSKDLVFDSSK